jgi:ribosomal protein S18 acetylase RimI-like enzyme
MIRTLCTSDLPHLFELGSSLFRPKDELPDLKKALDVCFLELSYVAVENGCILGFTLVCPVMTTVKDQTILPFRSGSYELAFFGVRPTCQGRGIGSRLLKETLHALFQRSFSCFLWLLVDGSNQGAIRMYESRGFQSYKWIHPEDAPEPCLLMVIASPLVTASPHKN